MDNTNILDHHGLFMYIDGSYFGFIICEHLTIFFHLLKLMPHFNHGDD
jgi:hypothetical protein